MPWQPQDYMLGIVVLQKLVFPRLKTTTLIAGRIPTLKGLQKIKKKRFQKRLCLVQPLGITEGKKSELQYRTQSVDRRGAIFGRQFL